MKYSMEHEHKYYVIPTGLALNTLQTKKKPSVFFDFGIHMLKMSEELINLGP